MRYLRGKLGNQVVGKEWKGRPYLSAMPIFRKRRKFTKKQIAHQDKFRDAVAYAKGAQQLEVYERIAEKKRLTGYQVAMRDAMRAPIIRDVYVEDRKSPPQIVIYAVDDTGVVSVQIVVSRDGEVIESGEAMRDELRATRWVYPLHTVEDLDNLSLEVTAVDRPGNRTKETVDFRTPS